MDKICAETTFRVEFYDVDMMQIVYHGNYLKYFEKARWALFEKLDYTYEEMKEDGFTFPVTQVSVKFIKPLVFGDYVRVVAVLEEYEIGINIRFEIYNAKTGELTTTGKSTQMAFDIECGVSSFACPPRLIQKAKVLLAKGNIKK